VGERRLARLNGEFDVRVERRFLEIHPETPAEGRPISELGYPPDRWARMMSNLERMGKAEGIVFSERTFTTGRGSGGGRPGRTVGTGVVRRGLRGAVGRRPGGSEKGLRREVMTGIDITIPIGEGGDNE